MICKTSNEQICIIPTVTLTPLHITEIINKSPYATFETLIHGIVYDGYHDDNINDIAIHYVLNTYGITINKPTQNQIDSYTNKNVLKFASNTFKFKNTSFICDDEQQYKTRCILKFWNYKFSSMYPNDVFLNFVDYRTYSFVRSKSTTIGLGKVKIRDVLRVFFDNHVPGMEHEYIKHMKHDTEIMDSFAKNSERYWRIRAAMYGSDKIRNVLMCDPDCGVRKTVARYGNDSHRNHFINDRANSVQCMAYQSTNNEQLRELIFRNQKITRSNQKFIKTVIQFGTNDIHIAKCKLFAI